MPARAHIARGITLLDRVGLKRPTVRLASLLLGQERLGRVKQSLGAPASPEPAATGSVWTPRDQGAIISLAPHSTKLYDYFIRTRLAAGDRFITSRELYAPDFTPDPDAAYILLRHDIDYSPETIEDLTEIERSHGVRSDIYVILSGRQYEAFAHSEMFRALASDGFVFGLHTCAPTEDDFFTVLRREIDEYARLMGGAPDYFTIHGPPSPPERPPDWAKKRTNFTDRIAPRLNSFGFVGSHNIAGVGAWLEDAAVGGEFSFLEAAWTDPPVRPGQVLGVLTHPCHWTPWPIKWHVDPETRREAAPIDGFVRAALRTSHPDSASQ
jgi:hypothetical protein